MEEFHAFLEKKKIDPVKFKKGHADRYEEFSMLFEQMHTDSLVAQKLFLINQLRRKYPFKAQAETTNKPAAQKKMKPRITPKTKK